MLRKKVMQAKFQARVSRGRVVGVFSLEGVAFRRTHVRTARLFFDGFLFASGKRLQRIVLLVNDLYAYHYATRVVAQRYHGQNSSEEIGSAREAA